LASVGCGWRRLAAVGVGWLRLAAVGNRLFATGYYAQLLRDKFFQEIQNYASIKLEIEFQLVCR
jgi:hypothetical protein